MHMKNHEEVPMRSFDYGKRAASVLDPETVKMLCEIHELTGRLRHLENDKSSVLSGLQDVAKLQSTASSVRISGYETTATRLKRLMSHQIEPRNRAERELLGYGEVLGMVYEYSLYMELTPEMIMRLYGDMHTYVPEIETNVWRTEEAIRKRPGRRKMPNYSIKTACAQDAPQMLRKLCETYEETINEECHDPLILMALFHLDFLCIRPFAHNNGKIARMVLILQLLRRSCFACRYISVDACIENTNAEYFESLKQSGLDWLNEENDDTAFVHYFLCTILSIYKEFDARVEFRRDKIQTKTERIRNVFNTSADNVGKSDIMRQCPDISMTMVEKTLSDLIQEGYIEKIGGGRGTVYRRTISY